LPDAGSFLPVTNAKTVPSKSVVVHISSFRFVFINMGNLRSTNPIPHAGDVGWRRQIAKKTTTFAIFILGVPRAAEWAQYSQIIFLTLLPVSDEASSSLGTTHQGVSGVAPGTDGVFFHSPHLHGGECGRSFKSVVQVRREMKNAPPPPGLLFALCKHCLRKKAFWLATIECVRDDRCAVQAQAAAAAFCTWKKDAFTVMSKIEVRKILP